MCNENSIIKFEEKKMKKYNVISLHPYLNGCNLKCPFCYVEKVKSKQTKSKKFWFEMIPLLSKLTEQVALGGSGEPFMDIPFVKKFAGECKKKKLICNVTSNGRLLMKLNDKQLKNTLKNITMVSLSFDDYKVKTAKDLLNYTQLVQRIKKITKCQVGSNLLINQKMFENNGKGLMSLVDNLFKIGCDRIFALCPKNILCPDILKFKLIYQILSVKHKHFYIDDCSKMILEENKYSDWKNKCHRGEGLISIGAEGGVSSCSFAKPFIKLYKPKDILKLKVPKKELGTHYCPFLNRKNEFGGYNKINKK